MPIAAYASSGRSTILRRSFAVIGLAGGLSLVGLLWAAGVVRAESKRVSPHERMTAQIGGVTITVEYGRPFKKGRNIFGGLVPYGEVWRTGADEATTLTTTGEVTVGGLKVPKGSYALFTVPGKDKWQLILNKEANQWGAFKYDPRQDLGRTDLKVSSTGGPVEELTITVTAAGDRRGALAISWDRTSASAEITAR